MPEELVLGMGGEVTRDPKPRKPRPRWGHLAGSYPVIPALFPYRNYDLKWEVGMNLSLSPSYLDREDLETRDIEGM